MSEDDLLICGVHGQTRATFMCRHLAGGTACGYHGSTGVPDDAWPDAWCDLCDEQVEDPADIKALCTHCYDAARDRNVVVPELLRGAAAQLDDDERARLWRGACAHMKAQQHLLDDVLSGGRWDFSAEERTLTFTRPDGPPRIASIRLIGSYATASGTFQWSWAMHRHDDPIVAGVHGLRELGIVRDIPELCRTWWACPIEEAWEAVSLAGYVLGARALYRAPFDDLFWFMLIDEIRTASSSPAPATGPA